MSTPKPGPGLFPRHPTPMTSGLEAAAATRARTARVHDVLQRYARLQRNNGKPMVCRASPSDPTDPRPRMGRVMFDNIESAQAAAVELQAIFGQPRPSRAYPCLRSRSGHHHLTDLQSDLQDYQGSGGATPL
jgi:hypothetical protein